MRARSTDSEIISGILLKYYTPLLAPRLLNSFKQIILAEAGIGRLSLCNVCAKDSTIKLHWRARIFRFCRKFGLGNMKIRNLKSVQGAVVLHEEVFLFADREVVTKLAEKVSQVHRLHCYKGSVFNIMRS